MAFVSLIQMLFHFTTISAIQNVGSSAFDTITRIN